MTFQSGRAQSSRQDERQDGLGGEGEIVRLSPVASARSWAFRSMGVRRLTGVGILIGLLACTDRAARPSPPPSPSPEPPALPGRSEIAAVQVPIAAVASAIKAGVDNGRDPALGSITPAERKELTALYSTEG